MWRPRPPSSCVRPPRRDFVPETSLTLLHRQVRVSRCSMNSMNLFPDLASPRQVPPYEGAPLADRMRPHRLEGFVGQQHPGRFRQTGAPASGKRPDRLPDSLGPAGDGQDHAGSHHRPRHPHGLRPFSAVLSGIKEIRSVMQEAERNRRSGRRTLLFIDEIHRFNKGPAGCLSALCGNRRHCPDRRHHRESFL